MKAGAAPSRKPWPLLWVSSTYFAEGFPYTLVNNLVEIMFEQLGASLQAIGLTSLLHVPWNLKFLWGPFVDEYETKRRWLLVSEVIICAIVLALAFVVGSVGQATLVVAAGFLVLAIASATHDIAIDGFYLEGLDDREQSAYVGWRATSYKIASVTLGGPLLWFIGRTGWFVGLVVIAVMMALITAYHVFILPHPETRKRPIRELMAVLARPRLLACVGAIAILVASERRWEWLRPHARRAIDWLRELPLVGEFSLSTWAVVALMAVLAVGAMWSAMRRSPMAASVRTTAGSAYVEAFTSFMDQRRAVLILAFVLTFRTGESFLMKMRWPFLHQVVDLGLDEYAIVNGTLGVVASFAATLVGGWLIARRGLRACLWPFVLAQNVFNLLYMGVAWFAQPEELPRWIVGGVIAIEHAGAGLGTAVFMVFLMRCCDPRHKAAHMAILTALMSVSFTVAGAASGFLADLLGFFWYFGMTFVATVPAMLLIPWLPHLDGREVARSAVDGGGDPAAGRASGGGA